MTTFRDLGLSSELIASVEQLGFENPTPIQEKAIPYLLSEQADLIGLASTGTGKTAAFGLPLLQLVNPNDRRTQGLILAPTRELCLQITNDLQQYAKQLPSIKITAVYGGANIRSQMSSLKAGTQIIVATPGRLMDLMERGSAKIQELDYVVLDEADEMLNMGFQEDIESIMSSVRKGYKTWLFSATMPAEVRRIANKFMTEPYELTVGTKNETNKNITHLYMIAQTRHRFDILKRIIDMNPDIYGLIFTRTKMDAQDLSDRLVREGYRADALHGDLSQNQRDRVMARYREKSVQLLVATDVAARGIDVDTLTHVINFGLPDELEVYTHRSGRTARAGKSGECISLILQKDKGKIKQLEKKTKAQFQLMDIPEPKDICANQLKNLVERVKKEEPNLKEMESFLPQLEDEFQDYSKEELLHKFLSLEFGRFLSHYANAKELTQDEDKNRNDYTFQRFFVSLGELDGLDKRGMFDFINSLGLGRIQIGRIEIKRSFSFLEVEEGREQEFMDAVNAFNFEGRQLKAEITDKPMSPSKKGKGRNDKFRGGGRSRDFGGKKDFGKKKDFKRKRAYRN